jgi:hypothetical protein
MSIKVVVKHAAAKVAKVLQETPEAFVQSSAREIADLIYESIDFSRIANVSPENVIKNELLAVADEFLVSVTKHLTDGSSVEEHLVLALEKLFNDIITVSESLVFNLAQYHEHVNTLLDRVSATLIKNASETIRAGDDSTLTLGKGFSEYPGVVDNFILSSLYSRHFYDYISLDDFAGIDKYYNGTKHNISFVSDSSSFTYGKSFDDNFISTDYVETFYTKNKSDEVTSTDSFDYSLSKSFDDLAQATDFFKFEEFRTVKRDNTFTNDEHNVILNKVYHDTAVPVDNVALAYTTSFDDLVSTTDYSDYTFVKDLGDTTAIVDAFGISYNKSETNDTYGINDYFVLGVTKNPANNVTANDSIRVTYLAGANAMFNVAQFNQSTFG